MLCYRDVTWCTGWKLCSMGDGCPRALTSEVRKQAAKAGLPLCMSNLLEACPEQTYRKQVRTWLRESSDRVREAKG